MESGTCLSLLVFSALVKNVFVSAGIFWVGSGTCPSPHVGSGLDHVPVYLRRCLGLD